MSEESYPTALIVDDYSDSRMILRRVLEMRHYRVIEASDGEEAVEAARRECPNLIIMDLNMPQMNGLEAVRKIRGLKGKCEDVVMIAITAFDTSGMREAAIEAGFDECLIKPFGFDDIDRILHNFFPEPRS